jgi:micrococcal nuclease
MNRALLLAFALLISSCDSGGASSESADDASTTAVVHGDPVGVVAVLDGDTLLVARGGSTFKVRLRGVDTPELNSDSDDGPEAYAEDARSFTFQNAGLEVGLEYDASCEPNPTSPCLDIFGRSLAYVRLGSGEDLGSELLRQGLARLMVFDDQPFDRLDSYVEAQTYAQESGLGIWSD